MDGVRTILYADVAPAARRLTVRDSVLLEMH